MSEDNRKVPVEVRRLSASDAVSYRDLRLDGLRAHPEAFGASWEDEAAQLLAWFANRIDRNVIFGGGLAGTSDLRGIVGFYVLDSAKQRHKFKKMLGYSCVVATCNVANSLPTLGNQDLTLGSKPEMHP